MSNEKEIRNDEPENGISTDNSDDAAFAEDGIGDGPSSGEDYAAENTEDESAVLPHRKVSGKYEKLTSEDTSRKRLTGMYKDWFLDYASYVILERAVPHVEDGFKPVQRRIMHSMRRLDDGRYNKVANVIGHTMQFHPHGDASIGDALVQLGQKDLLIDMQGNWGNLLTGDGAAAPRYIEARLSKFALDVVFNPKTTEWMLSYDGRNQEPVTLPVKFPLLLAQGVEGIAVGLASKILPHNFNELIEASIDHLKGKPFVLYPDFPTGGHIDVSRYNDGLRGGAVKVRAKISKIDKRTLAITEIPYGTTTESIKESIIKANEKGKIKIKKVDDNTAAAVEIIVHVSNDESTDKTIDALYAFTECEVSISPNACVICDEKPHFIGVTEILRRNTERTKQLLGKELEIRLGELDEEWHMASLERIFIENKMYQAIEGQTSREAAYDAVDQRLEPFKNRLRREVTREDIVKLTELKFIRISKYDSAKADNQIKGIEDEMEKVRHDLEHLTDYAIAWFKKIREKYGKGRERRSEIREFDNIEATKVVVANAKLYVDRAGGFFGIGNSMKKDEYVCDCSDIDDVIVFSADGKYIVTKVSEKAFFAPDIYYIGVFKKNDERTIYNVLYRDGDKGAILMKRCAIKGVTRDKEYDITKGTKGSKILYMSVNPNGEAEVLKIMFRQRARLKKSVVDLDFSKLAIKGRQSQGNLFSRYAIHKIMVKEKGASTLAGQNIWFDEDVLKMNTDGRGRLLGEFQGDDRVIVFTAKGQYYLTGYDVLHHFPEDTIRVEKYNPDTVYSVAYFDAASRYYYLKRFQAELTERMQDFVDAENPKSKMIAMSTDLYPRLEVVYAGMHKTRPADIIDVAEFIGVKSNKAKGKRITTFEVSKIRFVDPITPDIPDHGGPDDEDMVAEPLYGDLQDDIRLPSDIVEGVPDGDSVEEFPRETSGQAPDETDMDDVVQEDIQPDKKPAPVKKAARGRKPVSTPAGDTIENNSAETGKVSAEEIIAVPDKEPERRVVRKSTVIVADDDLIIEQAEDVDETRNPDIQQLNLF